MLKETFAEEVNFEAILTKMLQRTKRHGEDILTYFYEKLSLINACEFAGEKAVDLLIGGLKDASLQAGAKASRHETPTGLLQFLKTLKVGDASGPPRAPVRPRGGVDGNQPYMPRRQGHSQARVLCKVLCACRSR